METAPNSFSMTGDELAVVALEDVVHERGLAGAQETRHDLRMMDE